jgi:hypothetical protein
MLRYSGILTQFERIAEAGGVPLRLPTPPQPEWKGSFFEMLNRSIGQLIAKSSPNSH